MNPHGIMFHHFHDNNKHIRGQGSISASNLEEMIKYLQRDKIILSADEWMNRALNGKLKNNDICLTFDDNLLCQFEVALPVLDKYKIKAFWFIYTSPFMGILEKIEIYRYFRSAFFQNVDDFYDSFFSFLKHTEYIEEVSQALDSFIPSSYLIDFPFYTNEDRTFRYIRDQVLKPDRYYLLMDLMLKEYKVDLNSFKNMLWMTEENIKELCCNGHKIGLHTHSHPTSVGSMAPNIQAQEYQTNLRFISSIVGEAPDCMSHPCNSYNHDTIEVLEKLHIQLGFRANMKDNLYSNYEYPREDHANIIKKMGIEI